MTATRPRSIKQTVSLANPATTVATRKATAAHNNRSCQESQAAQGEGGRWKDDTGRWPREGSEEISGHLLNSNHTSPPSSPLLARHFSRQLVIRQGSRREPLTRTKVPPHPLFLTCFLASCSPLALRPDECFALASEARLGKGLLFASASQGRVCSDNCMCCHTERNCSSIFLTQ